MEITINTMMPCKPSCNEVYNYLFKGIGHIIGLEGKAVNNQCSTILLDKYRDGSYFKSLNRRKHRDYKKSQDMGFVFHQFIYKMHVPDVVDINTSKDFRSGGPLKDHYKYTVEQRGGYPTQKYEVQPFDCNLHARNIFHGVFKPEPGYKQGDVITNERLVVYNGIAVCGDMAIYSWNIGHGDYLKYGIMTQLTIDTVLYLLKEHPAVKYFVMGNWTDGLGVGTGLQDFKRECLFEPVYLIRG